MDKRELRSLGLKMDKLAKRQDSAVATHALVRDLQKNHGGQGVHNVFKSGSTKKCTEIGMASDVDIIVCLNKPVWEPDVPIKVWKAAALENLTLPQDFEERDRSSHAIRGKYMGLEFDVLPVPTKLWMMDEVAKKALLQQYRREWYWYSVALAQEQVLFVKKKKGGSTTSIRLLKAWAKALDWQESGAIQKPSSYVIELLVISLLPPANEWAPFWQKLSNNQLRRLRLYGPKKKKQPGPYLYDPVNEFNLLAGEEVFRGLAVYADRYCKEPNKFIEDLKIAVDSLESLPGAICSYMY